MKKEDFHELIGKYLSGNATEAEQRLLEEYYKRLPVQAPLLSAAEEETIRKEMLAAILEKAGIAPAHVIRLHRNRWLKYVAAAAVVLVLGTGSYFLFLNKEKPQPEQTTANSRYKNDVEPGGNKAILTLGNGSQVLLDSSKKGTIALQGNVKIVKTDSGKLSYDLAFNSPSRGGGQGEVLFNTLSTPNGGQYQLTLPDGTRVWLNAASSIKYPVVFSGKSRKVEITGEAYFEVVHNSKEPFEVKVGDQTIEDVGTAFNVNAYSDEPATVTSLVEGKIAVIHGTQKLMVRPGEQAREKDGQVTVAAGDIDRATAWRRGIFSFHHTDVAAMMRQLARWYNVEIKYESGIAADETFTGDMGRNLSLAQVLQGLRGMNLHFRIEEDKRIVIMP